MGSVMVREIQLLIVLPNGAAYAHQDVHVWSAL